MLKGKARNKQIARGDVFFADLSPSQDSEQSGIRPVVVVQNDKGNLYSPNIIVVAITSKNSKYRLPTHVLLDGDINGLSVVLAEHIRTISKNRLKDYISTLSEDAMERIDRALSVSLNLATAS